MSWKPTSLLLLITAAWSLNAQENPNRVIPKVRQGIRDALTLVQASIRTDVKPKDAQIYVDGNLVGTVKDYNSDKTRLFVNAGEHEIEFRKPGYNTYREHLSLTPSQDMRLHAKL